MIPDETTKRSNHLPTRSPAFAHLSNRPQPKPENLMTPDRHCQNLGSTVFLFALLSAGPALSANDVGLTDADEIAVNEAVARNDLPAIYKVIFAAIASAPDQAPAIVDEAARLAPNHRDAIVNTASAAFPEYTEQFAAAGGDDPKEKEKSPWSGEAEIGGLYQTGNSPLDTVSASGKLIYQRGDWENEFGLSYNFVNDSGTTTTRRFVARNQTKYSLSESWYATSRLRFVDDKDDGFQWQTFELVGPGYRIFDTDKLKLSVEAGPGLRQARERSADGGSVNNDLVGWAATDIAWKITEGTKFTNSFATSGNSKRVQLDNTTALTLKIVDDFSARLSYEVRHDTDPGDDANKTDTTAKASLVYGFGGGSN
jgi:putative salt-induced outer membrane protein